MLLLPRYCYAMSAAHDAVFCALFRAMRRYYADTLLSITMPVVIFLPSRAVERLCKNITLDAMLDVVPPMRAAYVTMSMMTVYAATVCLRARVLSSMRQLFMKRCAREICDERASVMSVR